MRPLFVALLALGLLIFESVLVKYLNLSITRIDVTVALVAYLALRAPLVSGAISAFLVGYLLDLASGSFTYLYTFLAVLLFLSARQAESLVDVRSSASFAVFAGAADVFHGLLALFFNWLVSPEAAVFGLLKAIPLQVVATAAAAALLYPVLRRLEPGTDRPTPGILG
ncbi:MAG: hypothetical protein ACKVPX_02005 [Myxococcaceae bacterium]